MNDSQVFSPTLLQEKDEAISQQVVHKNFQYNISYLAGFKVSSASNEMTVVATDYSLH